jgi:hypothetical protein
MPLPLLSSPGSECERVMRGDRGILTLSEIKLKQSEPVLPPTGLTPVNKGLTLDLIYLLATLCLFS